MEQKKRDRSCEIVKEIVKVKFILEPGILNTTKIIFRERVPRKIREDLNKCLAQSKIKTIWGNEDKMVMIR